VPIAYCLSGLHPSFARITISWSTDDAFLFRLHLKLAPDARVVVTIHFGQPHKNKEEAVKIISGNFALVLLLPSVEQTLTRT